MLKRLELLPEEALYMIERGSMFCWKRDGVDPSILKGTEMLDGAPMSVQQAYAEMIGTESLTLERYQVIRLEVEQLVIYRNSFHSQSSGLYIPKTLGICGHQDSTT